MNISESTNKKLDNLLTANGKKSDTVKYVSTKKDGLIERVLVSSEKQLITEDNKMVLFD